MYKQNLHAHSVYCDGKDSLEEMVLAAIEKGFDSIGFSGHSYTPFDERYCMSKSDTEKYYNECRSLREKYKGKIDVLCGIEQDFYAPKPEFDYDYIIGSVHYVLCGDEYVAVDENAEILVNAANKYYGGDIYTLVENYYTNVENVVSATNCDFIGHFDVISKFIETSPGYLDVTNERYIAAGKRAIEKLLLCNKPFEMNAGALSKGCRNEPYPSEYFLDLIRKGGGRILFNADCHDRNKLDFGRDKMMLLAKKVGFAEFSVLKNGSFISEPLV